MSYGRTQAARLPLIRAVRFTCVHGIAGIILSEPREGGLDDTRELQYPASQLHSSSKTSQGAISDSSSSPTTEEAGEAR
eukprot:429716-Heterocapsa_arctica.AAC.1